MTSQTFRRTARLATLALLALLTACSVVPTQPPAQPPLVVPTPPEPPIVKPAPKPPRIGLALGGGAARGFAHIGVIQVLEEAGIKVDLVAGTSAGSLVASLYASGKSGKEMQQLAETMDEGAITDWSFPLRGLIRGEALARFIRDKTGGKAIEQMSLPLGIVATDLSDGSSILFRSGDTGTAVRASSAVPAVFQPVKIGQREYVDGGLVSPVPVRFAREMGAQLVVAVDITSPPEKDPPGDAFRMLMQTFSIMGRSINMFELRDADVVIRPRLDGVGSADFTARRRAVQAGREAAQALVPLLRQRIAEKTR
ncbi:patatin-like phospholipase family protein [Roseateles sp. BYS87W]|uniref:Patatin-like phospholipase family protein n=1 Tax=Pelomonas baiyunensis TaxID=3299026 RepID=A0ABW7H3X8_9BURK